MIYNLRKYFIPDWLNERHKILEDVFFNIQPNTTVKNETHDNMFHRIVNESCSLSDILDIDFTVNNVAVTSTSWTPQLLYNYDGVKFNASNKFWEGIVFDKDVLLEVNRSVHNTFNPNYLTFVIVPKDFYLEHLYFDEGNPVIEYPIKCTAENATNRDDCTFTENSCIINNQYNTNNDVTVITFVEGGAYFMPDTMQNTYFHPYAGVIAHRLRCNVISLRYDNQNNYAPKFGIKGYPPLTHSNTETVDYIKSILNTKLQQTKKIYTMSWCLGVYDALSVGEQLECDSVWTFDYFLSNLKTNNVFYSYFEPDEKELADRTIGTTVPVDGLVLDMKTNYRNIELVAKNQYAKFNTIHASRIPNKSNSTLEMSLAKKHPFFEKYV